MTKEQALDELIAVEVQLTQLNEKRKNLRAIVLTQEFKPQPIPNHREVAGHVTVKRNLNAGVDILNVIKNHGDKLTASEIHSLLTNGANKNAVNLALMSLRRKGFVHCEQVPYGTGVINKWSLAVHPGE